jgi:hypothetical protein
MNSKQSKRSKLNVPPASVLKIENHGALALGIVALLAGGSIAQAVLLNPGESSGTSVLAVAGTDFDPTGPTDGSTLVASATTLFTGTDALSTVHFTANVNQAVVREASGFLTFYYQVVSLSGDPLGRLTINGFENNSTDVAINTFDVLSGDLLFNKGDNTPDFQSPPATISNAALYFNQDRSFTGGTIGFSFNKSGPLVNQLNPPESTFWLKIKTNATTFGQNSASLIDGATADNRILAPIPEPSTWLFGAVLTGVLMAARTHRRKSLCDPLD